MGIETFQLFVRNRDKLLLTTVRLGRKYTHFSAPINDSNMDGATASLRMQTNAANKGEFSEVSPER